jgi:hypothetical protein
MIEKQIRLQLAHIMAAHGDDPDTLLLKLEALVLEWHSNGVELGIDILNNSPHALECPNCSHTWEPGHMDWDMMVNRENWIEINQRE